MMRYGSLYPAMGCSGSAGPAKPDETSTPASRTASQLLPRSERFLEVIEGFIYAHQLTANFAVMHLNSPLAVEEMPRRGRWQLVFGFKTRGQAPGDVRGVIAQQSIFETQKKLGTPRLSLPRG